MSEHPYFLRGMALPLVGRPVLWVVLGVALTMTAHTRTLGGEAGHPVPWVRLDGFTQTDGGNVFALTLNPSAGHALLPGHAVPWVAANGPHDVVILVSTAASQTGDYRAKSLATLQSLLLKLGAGDRVELVAFDLGATRLTPGFVAPGSPQMAAAFSALKRRTPLGACDLEKALDTAAKSYASNPQYQVPRKSARAVVYIGDGSSRASPLSSDQLDRAVKNLVVRRAPVIAFGVGPQIEEQVLGVLASRTGGVVVPESAVQGADFYGIKLAEAVHSAVLWPKAGGSVKWPDGWDVYPKTLPPLRSDRDTVVVGTAKSGHPVLGVAVKQVEIDVDGPAGAERLAFAIPELKSDADNGYLVTLVEQAKRDDGRTLPLVDSASLATAKKEIEAGGRGLSDLAFKALHAGNLDSADKLAGEALNRNPNDLVARAIKHAIAAKKAGGLSAATAVGDAVTAAKNLPVASERGERGDLTLHGGNGAVAPPNGAAAANEIDQAKALEEQWQNDVQAAINKARSQVMVDPAKAEALIRQKTNDLAIVTELRAEMRDRLMGMLRTASREIKRRAEEYRHREQQRIREEVARREQEMAEAALEHRQNKLKQLMDRYDALMAEGRCRLAEEAAAEAAKIAEGNLPSAGPTMVVAGSSRFVGTYDDIMEVREAKQKGFVDAMARTEKSHVPTADDPPIVYPDAEFWRELTVRRTEKYNSTDLSHRSPVEKKIEEALKQPTQFEFVETPLKDVVDYLKDLHKIEIQLDVAALKEVGVEDNTPITKNLRGISLRSALKLLLDELQLKYVIHNEVLLITSPAKAESEEYLTAEVYPMPDLLLPIKHSGFTGGFGGLGGTNGTLGGNLIGGGNPMGNGNMNGGNPMGNGNPFGGNPMGNGNPFGGNNQVGNGVFNVPREILPGGNQDILED